MGAAAAVGSILGGVGSVLGAGSSAASSALNYQAQIDANNKNLQAVQETNAMNKEIAQMNNDFNAAQFDKQINYNREATANQQAFIESMWNKTNEYNSPANQMKLAREAGLNPYNVAGQIAGSSAAGSASASSTMGVNPPSASPYSAIPGQIQAPQLHLEGIIEQALDAYQRFSLAGAELDSTREKTQGIRIENKYKAAEIIARLGNLMENTKSQELKNAYQSIINSYAKDYQQLGLDKGVNDLKLQTLNMRTISLQQAAQVEQLKTLPEQLRIGISLAYADLNQRAATSKLTLQQYRTELYKSVEQQFKASGQKLNTELLNKTVDSLVNQTKNLAEKSYYDSIHSRNNRGPEGVYGLLNLFNNGIDQFVNYIFK